jgi:pimeloyl-ACP methyl ester carboxylesterase
MTRSGPRPLEKPVAVPDDVLADLRRRLLDTRWPHSHEDHDDSYGVPVTYLRELASYWVHEFDWRAAERAINAYEHYQVDVAGIEVHFMRRRGSGANAVPLILSHGWPWTFWHWAKVIDRLADPAAHGADPLDSFDVIVPSLPGFGFSPLPVDRRDMNFSEIADIWHELMTGPLGYTRYGAAGCDVGALVTGQLGHKYADELYAIHIGSAQKLSLFNGDLAWSVVGPQFGDDDMSSLLRQRAVGLSKRFAVHLASHVLEPTTLAYGLADSPAGMLAWLLQRWTAWSDNNGNVENVFTRDELLTHATIYWVSNTLETSVRTYANNNRHPWTPTHTRWPVVEAPTGITLVGYENPPGVATVAQRVDHFLASDRADWYRVVNLTAHERGGHFIPCEIPDEWIDDVRQTFRAYRDEAAIRAAPLGSSS